MRNDFRALMTATAGAAIALVPNVARAQRAAENAVASAEDAFGKNVGTENTGIYSEHDTRGFSPTKAGNVRVDGIYMDTVQVLPGRVRQSTTIRVGFAAVEFPFHAPTGIVDHTFRPFPDSFGVSSTFNKTAYGGWIVDFDVRLPVIKDHLSLTGGIAMADVRQPDGASNRSHGVSLRPIIRLAGAEIAPFVNRGRFFENYTRPLIVVSNTALPKLPKKGFLGQRWAKGSLANNNAGITVKAPITADISLRGGFFIAEGDRIRNYTEIFSILPGAGDTARYRMIADPRQDIQSTSGEAQIAWRIASGNWQHRFIAGYRARNRLTETGGSSLREIAEVPFGVENFRPRERFTYRAVNANRVRQSAFMAGYLGKAEGLGSINLGVQKARYRGTARDGQTGEVTASRDDPWLYNATLLVDLTPKISVYAGTEKGLEDSGTAPENAVNGRDQLPATRTRQYEGGVRWRFRGGQLVVSAFEITKPYFSFDAGGLFTQLGKVRHRGLETSLSGHFGDRLNMVAGGLIMQPRVSGAAVDSGLIGKHPAGTPSLFGKVDVNYRTDLFGGLTPTAGVTYTGKRAVGARPVAGKQLMVPGFASVDLGLRQQMQLGTVPASIRAVVQNVFDVRRWKVVAANTIYADDRRRFIMTLAADF